MDIEEPSLSGRYRKFIMSGGARILTTRFFSLLYTIVAARLIMKDDMAVLIILASTQALLVFFSRYGLQFSAVHFGVGKRRVEGGESLPFQVTLFAGVPSMILLTEAIISLFWLLQGSGSIFSPLADPMLHILYLLSNVLAILLEGVIYSQVAMLNSDKEAALRAAYSIMNSIFVPLAYYLEGTILSVVVTWTVILLVDVLLGIAMFPQRSRLFVLNRARVEEIIRYGFVYNLSAFFATVSFQYDQFIIYEFYNPETLTDYYWPQRIATIGLEAFSIILTGVFPILAKLESTYGKEVAIERFKSLFKLGIYFGSIFFTGFVLYADMGIGILLGSAYGASVFYLQLFAVMVWLKSISVMLTTRLNSSGARRKATYMALVGAGLRMLFVTIGAMVSVAMIIVAKASVFIVMAGIMVSFRSIMGIGFREVGKYASLGAIHLLLGFVLYMLIPNIVIRIVVGFIVAAVSIFLSFKSGFITESDKKFIRRTLKRK